MNLSAKSYFCSFYLNELAQTFSTESYKEYGHWVYYLDDVIVFGWTVDETVTNLDLVFREANLKLKPSKCKTI